MKHRVGVGEFAFFAAVSYEHGQEGVKGIDFIVDEVESKVPVWELENSDDGSECWKWGHTFRVERAGPSG